MTPNQLEKLFIEQIGDLYDAEKQLVKALPKLEKAADSEELATAIHEHLAETEDQVRRLEQVFDVMEIPAKAKPCKAMKGLIQEGSEAIETALYLVRQQRRLNPHQPGASRLFKGEKCPAHLARG